MRAVAENTMRLGPVSTGGGMSGVCFFFFQAEDGIRDIGVTGVQTCALPICKLASKYFNLVGVEVYPMNTDEYAYLNSCGADYVTVFQETYNSDKYETLHLAGHKRIFPYRLNAQERALRGGMRGVGRSEEHTSELQSRQYLV